VRPVVIGVTEGNDAAIESGLANGEQVVIDGADRLQAGSKVQVGGKQGSGE
jgi:multidrug efflux system membrane fusion protein